ncbi:MAG: aldehyde dehydrogenase family protein, partial [Anaerolineales bacterium]
MINHFINNEFAPALNGEAFETLNPATNEPIETVAAGSAADVDAAVRAARAAFDEGPWPRMSASERARMLRRIGDLIEKHADEIGDVEIRDSGVPASQIKKGTIARAAQ